MLNPKLIQEIMEPPPVKKSKSSLGRQSTIARQLGNPPLEDDELSMHSEPPKSSIPQQQNVVADIVDSNSDNIVVANNNNNNPASGRPVVEQQQEQQQQQQQQQQPSTLSPSAVSDASSKVSSLPFNFDL